jgi:hypothetical protein
VLTNSSPSPRRLVKAPMAVTQSTATASVAVFPFDFYMKSIDLLLSKCKGDADFADLSFYAEFSLERNGSTALYILTLYRTFLPLGAIEEPCCSGLQ